MADDRIPYRDEIAQEIIARIEAGTAPWQQPWEPGRIESPPFNPTTGKPYRGINDLWLTLHGFSDPRWMTYRQAAEQGAQVRKGERSATIEYWQWTERTPATDADGKPVFDADGNRRYIEARLERPKVFYAKVFNGTQIDGLEPWQAKAPTFDPIERAEAIIAGCGVPVLHDQQDRAFYRPFTDKIHLNPRADFKNAAAYYETVLHELGHATGHETRLDRFFAPPGAEAYAREELRAEIASYMLARDLGIGFDPSNHAAYVENWLTALKEDKHEIFRAARDAEIIKTWVMEPEQRQALEQAGQARAAAERAGEQTMEQPIARAYLTVPFAERGAAREAGAKWDGDVKRWYVPEGMDPSAFAKWTDQPRQAPTDRGRAAVAETKPATSPVLSAAEIVERLNAADIHWRQVEIDLKRSFSYEATMDDSWKRELTNILVEQGFTARETEALLTRAEIATNWPVHIATHLKLDGAEDLKAIAGSLAWERDPDNANQLEAATDTQIENIWRDRRHFARQSSDHAELLSVVADQFQAGQSIPGYVPPERRQNEVVQALGRGRPEEKAFQILGIPAEFRRDGQQQGPTVEAAPPIEPPKRIFLAVPYAEKDEAKSAGAKWSKADKSWWIAEGTDPAPFQKWLSGPAVSKAAEVSPEKEFGDFLRAHGLVIDGDPVMDGQWRYVQVDGDHGGKKSGSYVGYLPRSESDKAAGLAKNFKDGEDAHKWVATGAALTAEQRAELAAQAAQTRAQRETDRRQAAEVAARKAFGVWQNLPDGASPETCCPYLAKKGVQGHGVKVAEDGRLVVPQRDASGRLWGVQFCGPEGKRYIKNNLHVGTMHVIEPTGTGTLDAITPAIGGTIVIATGYATAASIHEATGRPVVVAFDDSNLAQVAAAVKARHPERELLIAADNDHANVHGNVGSRKAEEVAQAIGAAWVAPKFTDAEKAAKLTDFNDLATSRGKAAVKQAIDEALSRKRGGELARGAA